uniref:G-protein coupled receptors family 1 profile domain-containing protein n=1 Tax=Acanthochromis polyacanthus TaxID=80966 RepID=A0A3Q1GHB7_9TELE
ISEFLLLSVMAYDRYVSICKPLQYPTIMTKNAVTVFLVLCWIVPASHIAVQTILSAKAKLCDFNLNSVFCNNAVYRLQCVASRIIYIFGVVGLLDHVILPLLFIVFTYARILVISYRSCKEVRKKAAETCLPHLLVLINVSLLTVYNTIMNCITFVLTISKSCIVSVASVSLRLQLKIIYLVLLIFKDNLFALNHYICVILHI